jgi:hypothetical protein
MEQTSTSIPRRYRARGPETWAHIRETYLSGASARTLAARFDVTEAAIWRRAAKEGWKKQGRRGPTPITTLPALISPSPRPRGPRRILPSALQAQALAASAQAMEENRLDEALRLARLAESYGRISSGRPWVDVEG